MHCGSKIIRIWNKKNSKQRKKAKRGEYIIILYAPIKSLEFAIYIVFQQSSELVIWGLAWVFRISSIMFSSIFFQKVT